MAPPIASRGPTQTEGVTWFFAYRSRSRLALILIRDEEVVGSSPARSEALSRILIGPLRGYAVPVTPLFGSARRGKNRPMVTNRPASDSTMNTTWWTWSLPGGSRATRCTVQKTG
jgi:hypothetical protein